MANHASALKRHRQSLKARARNRAMKTRVKNLVKAVREAVEEKDKERAQEALKRAVSVLDKAATKKVIHWRNASRRISRLELAVNKLD
ncbi:MAG: 30S ribosomal protein S20 [Desulfovibrio sp.]|nr:MAG: 30S ribosomal protein S20 [Desulfovibrio sp.]